MGFTQQWKEHIDRRVFHYRKVDLNINVLTMKGYFLGGFSCKAGFLELYLGAEIFIKGAFNVKCALERSHPDQKIASNFGFGATGAIGMGAEAKFVPGSEVLFKVSCAVYTGGELDGMFWPFHKGGCHFDLTPKIILPKFTFTISVILLGTFQKAIPIFWYKEVKHKFTWPKPMKDEMDKQTEQIEKDRAGAMKRAKKADARYRKHMSKRT
jgi:hypothetical protein